jgi:arylsulfatase
LSLSRALYAPILLLFVACSGDDGDTSSGQPIAGKLDSPPSIVVVTVDTLRADHLHAYGYHRETSPHLDALAAEGVLFERAFAAMATTLPSHVSLFSGVYPHQHGITQNRWGRRPFPGDGGLESAAQLLRDDGYTTAAFVSAAPVKRVTGVAVGFDVFDEPKSYEVKGRRTSSQAIAWLDRGPREPFLLWVHLWDPHEPNRPSAEWAARFPSDPELDLVIDQRRIDPQRLAREFAAPALRRFLAPGSGERDDPAPVVDREAVRGMLNRYDGDVAAADRELGRLLDALRARGVLDRSIVVVTADHGQSLGQHDWLPHGQITNENLHVPLIVRFPPGVVRPPLRVARVVSLVDVMPTVLARFDGEASRRFLAQAEGQDVLAGAPLRGWALAQRTSKRHASWQRGDEFALVTDRFKYVRRAGGEDELYDLDADPGELTDVSARYPEARVELRRTLGEVLRRRPAAAKTDAAAGKESAPDDEHVEALRSLGYVDE